jgi:hypothetical protein
LKSAAACIQGASIDTADDLDYGVVGHKKQVRCFAFLFNIVNNLQQ